MKEKREKQLQQKTSKNRKEQGRAGAIVKR